MASIVLAGGTGSRLGQPKTLVEIGGVPLLRRVVAVAEQVSRPVLVVTRNDVPLPPLGPVTVVKDLSPLQGVAVGLLTGLQYSPDERNLLVGGDHPFLNPALLRALLDALSGFQAAVPLVRQQPHPLCAAYDCSVAPTLAEAIARGDTGIRPLLPRLRVNFLPESALRRVDPDLLSLRNINTPADLEQALAQLHPG